jgi:hypothetical protein
LFATRKKSSSAATTRRKTNSSTTTRRKSTSSTSRRRTTQASSGGLSSLKRTRSTRRSGATTTSRRASLASDLKKYADEEYTSTELTHGALIMVQREGMEAVRAALMALLGGNIPIFGSGMSDNAVDALVDQLADDYKKLAADERKALRAVLHWLSGKFEADEETRNNLIATFTNLNRQR